MPHIEEPSGGPASTSPVEDVGADTQRRFRHQACYAAVLSLGLLDGGPIVELFCEHHDDVILRLASGTFKALQFKTRMIGGVPFRANESTIIAALYKFASLEVQFPGQFAAYVLGSNVGFWHEHKNGNNLEYLLDCLRNGSDGTATALINKISKKKPTIAPVNVLTVLRKVELLNTPGLNDAEMKLRDQLAQISEFRNRRYEELVVASEALLSKILAASSLAAIGALPEYLLLSSDSSQVVKDENVIRSKRITREIVSGALNGALLPTTLLRTYQQVSIDDLPTSMNKMEVKMVVGGLTLAEIEYLKDVKYSTETLLQEWLYKYGKERAQRYYEHLRVMVQGECLIARQSSHQEDVQYASKMLSELQRLLKERRETQSGDTPALRREHLLGMAGILTEDCTVWWSEVFEIPAGRQ
jgi:hypothetical protein